jgi:hypothetical protein
MSRLFGASGILKVRPNREESPELKGVLRERRKSRKKLALRVQVLGRSMLRPYRIPRYIKLRLLEGSWVGKILGSFLVQIVDEGASGGRNADRALENDIFR